MILLLGGSRGGRTESRRELRCFVVGWLVGVWGGAGAQAGSGISGPRGSLDAGNVPHGHAFQYDVGFHGIRHPDYPNDYGDNARGGIDPQQAFSDGSPVPVDGSWHAGS